MDAPREVVVHMSPAKSTKQANLMRAAEHGAQFPMAKKVRASMTPEQMQEFAQGPMTALTPSKRMPKRLK